MAADSLAREELSTMTAPPDQSSPQPTLRKLPIVHSKKTTKLSGLVLEWTFGKSVSQTLKSFKH